MQRACGCNHMTHLAVLSITIRCCLSSAPTNVLSGAPDPSTDSVPRLTRRRPSRPSAAARRAPATPRGTRQKLRACPARWKPCRVDAAPTSVSH